MVEGWTGWTGWMFWTGWTGWMFWTGWTGWMFWTGWIMDNGKKSVYSYNHLFIPFYSLNATFHVNLRLQLSI